MTNQDRKEAIDTLVWGSMQLGFIGLMSWWVRVYIAAMPPYLWPTSVNPLSAPIEVWPIVIILEGFLFLTVVGLVLLTLGIVYRTLAAICVLAKGRSAT